MGSVSYPAISLIYVYKLRSARSQDHDPLGDMGAQDLEYNQAMEKDLSKVEEIDLTGSIDKTAEKR